MEFLQRDNDMSFKRLCQEHNAQEVVQQLFHFMTWCFGSGCHTSYPDIQECMLVIPSCVVWVYCAYLAPTLTVNWTLKPVAAELMLCGHALIESWRRIFITQCKTGNSIPCVINDTLAAGLFWELGSKPPQWVKPWKPAPTARQALKRSSNLVNTGRRTSRRHRQQQWEPEVVMMGGWHMFIG